KRSIIRANMLETGSSLSVPLTLEIQAFKSQGRLRRQEGQIRLFVFRSKPEHGRSARTGTQDECFLLKVKGRSDKRPRPANLDGVAALGCGHSVSQVGEALLRSGGACQKSEWLESRRSDGSIVWISRVGRREAAIENWSKPECCHDKD